MKTIKNIAAQGDVFIRRIKELPNGLVEAKSTDGKYVVGHSETGHFHIVKERSAQHLIDKTNEFISYLKVDNDGAVLEHESSFDTHEAINLPAGVYKITNQREYTPEGFRKAQD